MILGQSLPENRNNSDRITFHSARIVFQIRPDCVSNPHYCDRGFRLKSQLMIP